MHPELRYETLESPLGPLVLALHGDAMCGLEFADALPRLQHWLTRAFGAPPMPPPASMASPDSRAARCLARYFAGDVAAIDEVEIDIPGTPFQQRCWQALRDVPAGTHSTYAAQAARLGHPRAARAVGLANARNPIAIVVPCHRLVGADGTLTGYAGGLARKAWLLEHERRHARRESVA